MGLVLLAKALMADGVSAGAMATSTGLAESCCAFLRNSTTSTFCVVIRIFGQFSMSSCKNFAKFRSILHSPRLAPCIHRKGPSGQGPLRRSLMWKRFSTAGTLATAFAAVPIAKRAKSSALNMVVFPENFD